MWCLSLKSYHINDDQVHLLVEGLLSNHCSKLESLDLSDNKIGDAGAKDLVRVCLAIALSHWLVLKCLQFLLA